MRGVRRALPSPPDPRDAFILPSYKKPSYYHKPRSERALIFKAATVLGFHAMLRFGAFCQFNAKALCLVLTNGHELRISNTQIQRLPNLRRFLLGVIYRFEPKYTSAHSWGAAYFCHICVVAPSFKSHCPVCIIIKLWRRGHLRDPFHPVYNPTFFSPPALSSYLGHIAGKLGRHPRNPFKLELFRTIGLVGFCPKIRFYPSPLRSDKSTVLKNPNSAPLR